MGLSALPAHAQTPIKVYLKPHIGSAHATTLKTHLKTHPLNKISLHKNTYLILRIVDYTLENQTQTTLTQRPIVGQNLTGQLILQGELWQADQMLWMRQVKTQKNLEARTPVLQPLLNPMSTYQYAPSGLYSHTQKDPKQLLSNTLFHLSLNTIEHDLKKHITKHKLQGGIHL